MTSKAMNTKKVTIKKVNSRLLAPETAPESSAAETEAADKSALETSQSENVASGAVASELVGTESTDSETITLPVFPLPIFLLPDGVTRLRIFEQRYLKLVRIATKEQGFAILLDSIDLGFPEVSWASWVDVIDFETADDGVLIVDVKCKKLVAIKTMEMDDDRLRFASVEKLEHWPAFEHDVTTKSLLTELEAVFDDNEPLQSLYKEKDLHSANWTVARWLELLPIDVREKAGFANKLSYQSAKSFVDSIIFNKE